MATESQPQHQPLNPSVVAEKHLLQLAKPIRPLEFRLFTAIPFTSLFIALMTVLAVLFQKSKPHGK
jgi:hypothetical protein